MESVPYGVTSCLYLGISTQIQALNNTLELHENGTQSIIPKLLAQDIKVVEEAMEFYSKNCVLSYRFLEEAYKPVKDRYKKVLEDFESLG